MALEPITRKEKIIAGQDLTPITRMEKLLKQSGGGGGGLPSGGAPYQQLVTDGDGNAKWQDRLVYETDPIIDEIFPEQTLTYGEDIGGTYLFSIPDFTIIQNSEYTVVFDGVEYKCRSAELGGMAYIGNATILGAPVEDTGEPFIIAPMSGMVVVTTTDGPHTISLSGKKVVYHQLPLDYITNGFALSGMIYHNSKTITDAEINAYRKAMDTAFHPILKWVISADRDPIFIDGIWKELLANGESYYGMRLLNGERYKIPVNSDGVYGLDNISYGQLSLGELSYPDTESGAVTHSNASLTFKSLEPVTVEPWSIYSGASVETPLFKVEKNGKTSGQNFEVLGDGTVKAYSVILPSSTKGSTKKFKITVDDSGAISATEVTA